MITDKIEYAINDCAIINGPQFFEERINSKFYNIYIVEKDRNYEVIFINSLFTLDMVSINS